MDKLTLTHTDCLRLAHDVWAEILRTWAGSTFVRIYGVPRGGVPVLYLLRGVDNNTRHLVMPVGAPEEADYIVDDIVASGKTKERYTSKYGKPFIALCDYLAPTARAGKWIVFPWEQEQGRDSSADDIVTRLLEFIGEDPKRGGLVDTPQRVLKAWKEWTAGYGQDPAKHLVAFADGGENYDQMLWEKDIPFYSHCEHHLAPFFGTATIAYIPDKCIVGLSKLARVLHVFSRRLQVQERMTTQVADALFNSLKPKGVAVLIKARHLCMESRGIGLQGHHTVTSALRGEFMTDAKVRSEFLSIAQ